MIEKVGARSQKVNRQKVKNVIGKSELESWSWVGSWQKKNNKKVQLDHKKSPETLKIVIFKYKTSIKKAHHDLQKASP